MSGNKGKGKRKVIRKRDPSEDSDPEPKVILKFIGFIELSELSYSFPPEHLFNFYPRECSVFQYFNKLRRLSIDHL